MSNRVYKSNGADKYEAYIVPRDNFIHDDYYVSNYQACFSMRNAYLILNKGPSIGFGIDKKTYKVSSQGILIDNCSVGKSDI